MKRVKLILKSHYNGIELPILIPENKAEKLMSEEEPIKDIIEDVDRVYVGFEPKYLSKGQARKIDSYFRGSVEYFDKVLRYEKRGL